MCHFKLGKPVHHQNLLWQLLMLSISQIPNPIRPHVMSWLLKWKASPARCQPAEMTGKIVPGVCSGCGQPRKPPADSEQALGAVPGTCISSLWYLNQISAC